MVAEKGPVDKFPSRDLKKQKQSIRGDQNLLAVDGRTNSKLFAGAFARAYV